MNIYHIDVRTSLTKNEKCQIMLFPRKGLPMVTLFYAQ